MSEKFIETDSQYIVDVEVQCGSCKGSGLYKGVSENGGAAVVCYHCNGAGKTRAKFTMEKFKERTIRPGVTRIYQTAGGYGITDQDITTKEGMYIPFSKYGVDYNKWLEGEKPEPIKCLHCPLIHYGQGTPEGETFKEKVCTKNNRVGLGGSIFKCAELHKEECWTIESEVLKDVE